MQLFIIFLIFLVFIVFATGGQWKARVALKQVSNSLKFFFKLSFRVFVGDVHEELVNDAAEAPEVGSLVV
jgi:hypothetical protein